MQKSNNSTTTTLVPHRKPGEFSDANEQANSPLSEKEMLPLNRVPVDDFYLKLLPSKACFTVREVRLRLFDRSKLNESSFKVKLEWPILDFVSNDKLGDYYPRI